MNLRITMRNAVARTLEMIPLNLLLPVRTMYHTTVNDTLINKAVRSLIRILQYRKPDPSIEVFSIVDEPNLLFTNDGSSFSRRLFWYGKQGLDSAEISLWSQLCSNSKGILEIGANVGYFTVHGAAAAPCIPYTAVEPHPVSAHYLRKNLNVNNISHVNVVQAAVVGSVLTTHMQLMVPQADPDATPAGAYLMGAESINRPPRDSVEVNVVAAKELMEGVDLLKLDVEGYEYEILNALIPTMQSSRIIVYTEVRRNTSKLRSLISQLALQSDYVIYAITSRGLQPISPEEILHISLQEKFHTRDVLLVNRLRALVL